MKIVETNLGEVHEVALLTPGGRTGLAEQVQLQRDVGNDAWRLVDDKGRTAQVEPANPQAGELLRLLLDRGGHVFLFFEQNSERSATLHARGWSKTLRDDRAYTLLIPPEVGESMKEWQRADLQRWWADEMVAEHRGEAWVFAYHGGSGAGKGLDAAFTLLGKHQQVGVRRLAVAGDAAVFVADSIKTRRKGRSKLLALGASFSLRIERVTAGEVYAATAPPVSSESAFLAEWGRYLAREEALVKAEAERMGVHRYNRFRRESGTMVFTLDGPPPAEWLHPRSPVPIACTVLGRDELIGGLLGRVDGEAHAVRVEVDDPDTDPPKFGTLFVSTVGDTSRLKRQTRAKDVVVNGAATLPDLLNVLDGRGREARTDTPRRALSAAVMEALGRAPTTAQQAAIEVALNTPDIALIQGPPGTGKTTVIRAVAQRLHEEGRHPVLVCSHQHEAVLNVIEGMSVGGLPIPRIGSRRGEDIWSAQRQLWSWVAHVAETSEGSAQRLPTPPASAVRDRVFQRRLDLEAGPLSRERARAALRGVEAEAGAILGQAALKVLREAITRCEAPPAIVEVPPEEERRRVRVLIDRQRTTTDAWADDGPECAARLGRHLEGLTWAPAHLVQRVVEAGLGQRQGGPPLGWEAVIDGLRTACDSTETGPDAELSFVGQALDAVLEDLTDTSTRGGEGLADALLRLADRLRRDPDVVEQVLQTHSTVLGSTASQAAGKAMTMLHPRFDTLIVDEAARASPLDLLVPLSRARRIILVGDHKQLPHLLEPAVEEMYEQAGEGDTVEALREGLFQRLWSRYEAAPPGGIPRCVVLDEQFRMHPVIGSLVSSCFYAGAVRNGVTAADRPPVLSLSAQPVGYWDVPSQAGPERRSPAGSRFRDAEVEALIGPLRRVVEDEPINLTIGVISFYSEQVSRIKRRLEEEDLFERVAVGTVDAFQGRDFDVVLLSCVRCGGSVGFLALPNRLNVAMSRAKRFLGVFGDLRTVRRVPALGQLIDLVRSLEASNA